MNERSYVESTFRLELGHRWANVPYFAGHGGMTPPAGSVVGTDGKVAGWSPDLVQSENRLTLAMMVRF